MVISFILFIAYLLPEMLTKCLFEHFYLSLCKAIFWVLHLHWQELNTKCEYYLKAYWVKLFSVNLISWSTRSIWSASNYCSRCFIVHIYIVFLPFWSAPSCFASFVPLLFSSPPMPSKYYEPWFSCRGSRRKDIEGSTKLFFLNNRFCIEIKLRGLWRHTTQPNTYLLTYRVN